MKNPKNLRKSKNRRLGHRTFCFKTKKLGKWKVGFHEKPRRTLVFTYQNPLFTENAKIRYSSWLLIPMVGWPNGAPGEPWGPLGPGALGAPGGLFQAYI